MKIAILGGYGDVGTAACRFLLSLNITNLTELRIGGRQAIERQSQHQAQLSSHLQNSQASDDIVLSYHNVDFQQADPQQVNSLDTFIDGCQLILNCAGPSHLIGDKVAKVAANNKVIYVDVAGDEPLYAQLDHADYQQQGQIAILSAGLQPGLTGLFPRWLAEQAFADVETLECYFGVRDKFTAVAAEDYLQAATEQASALSGAAWQKGDIVSGALTRQTAVTLPFFTEEVTTLPMLNAENIRCAESLKLSYGAWYNAIAGKHILNTFNCIHGISRDEAIAALCRASELDLAGRQAYATMLVQMSGDLNSEAKDSQSQQVRTAVLQSARGGGNALLSGAMAAITVKAALNGDIKAGVHYCAQALSPTTSINELEQIGALSVLTILETSIEAMVSLEEEGAI